MLDVPIQDPSPGIFSSDDLVWTGNVAHIPWGRLQDFVDGEGRRDIQRETSFWIRDSKDSSDRPKGKLLTRKVYWCHFGPQVEPDCVPNVPPKKGTHPTEGEGSRPRARKKQFNNHPKRGCMCHFVVKRYKAAPDVVEIVHADRIHVNKEGKQVHGSIREKNLIDVTWGPKSTVAPRLTCDLKKTLLDLLRAGWRVLDVYDLHCKNQFVKEGGVRGIDLDVIQPLTSGDGRDDLVSLKDLYNLRAKVASEDVCKDNNDQKSVSMWIENNIDKVLVHHEYKKGPPEQDFILAVQSPWQLANMIQMSHGSALAMDSTFATNKYMFPFFTLVTFDEHQMGFPAAWSIQMRETAEEIGLFLEAVKAKALRIKPDWKPACFIIDCAEAEVKALQAVFPGIPIYFCSWHVRRAWKDNIIKKVKDKSKILDMNDELGDLMYASNEETMHAIWSAFKEKYSHEKDFSVYFDNQWMTQTAKWMKAMRTMNRANQETNGAIEAWHLTLKKMIARKIGDISAMRLDAIIDMLFTCMLPFFYYNIRCKKLGRKINYQKEEIMVNSLHLAKHQLRDYQVSFPDPDNPNKAIVLSSSTAGRHRIVRNIYSNFPSCSCEWADQGNMCKHQIKALLLRGHEGGVLVQQLGTRFGSNRGGISHLDSSQNSSLVVSEPVEEFCLPDEIRDDESDDSQSDAEVDKRMKGRKVESLKAAWAELLTVVEGNDSLAEKALVPSRQILSQIKQMSQSLLLSGKEVISTNDRFLRPLHITSKRRLGVVDIYHGGKQGKRVTADDTFKIPDNPKKKRGIRKPKGTSVDEVRTQEKRPPMPDALPRLKRRQRESHREQLGRLQHNAIEGVTKRKSVTRDQVKISLPKRPVTYFNGLSREMELGIDLDLNGSPANILIIHSASLGFIII